jgi:hypothetical protein
MTKEISFKDIMSSYKVVSSLQNIKGDILENFILNKYPEVLDLLLRDNTTRQNIIWATDSYIEFGKEYKSNKPILLELITGKNDGIIMPRVQKNKELQKSRSKVMAEIFTPSWVCNMQNNLIDNAWFERENNFNTELEKTWQTNNNKIIFSKDKKWQDYIEDTRLEITCGEAPYLTSRYDTTTGEFIHIKNRIGLLDRKLRVINENVEEQSNWIKMAQTAFLNIYGFEWQGDNLLLAREALLFTFIENYELKFGIEPDLKDILLIANIISWNIWQMDGLKGVIPNSCNPEETLTEDIFGETEKVITECEGCKKNNIYKHNGIYALIKDWGEKDLLTGKKSKTIKYIDLLKK